MSRIKTIFKWMAYILLAAYIIFSMISLFIEFPMIAKIIGIVLGSLIALIAVLLASVSIPNAINRRFHGYWFEHISSGILRGGEHEWAEVYHEANNELWFIGDLDEDGKEVLFAPTEEDWRSQVNPWAQDRRDIILKRLQKHRPHHPIRPMRPGDSLYKGMTEDDYARIEKWAEEFKERENKRNKQ